MRDGHPAAAVWRTFSHTIKCGLSVVEACLDPYDRLTDRPNVIL